MSGFFLTIEMLYNAYCLLQKLWLHCGFILQESCGVRCLLHSQCKNRCCRYLEGVNAPPHQETTDDIWLCSSCLPSRSLHRCQKVYFISCQNNYHYCPLPFPMHTHMLFCWVGFFSGQLHGELTQTQCMDTMPLQCCIISFSQVVLIISQLH